MSWLLVTISKLSDRHIHYDVPVLEMVNNASFSGDLYFHLWHINFNVS